MANHFQLLQGDNLALLQVMPTASIELIYADPPFNSGKAYFQTQAHTAAYDDHWRWTQETTQQYAQLIREMPSKYSHALTHLHALFGESDALCYLLFLAPRIQHMQRVLKPSGSLYLHVDVRMSHLVRVLLDSAFGREQFRNEIVWAYRTGGAGKKHFSRKHDCILFYSASTNATFHPQYERVRYAKKFFSAQQDEHGFYADVLQRDVWDIPAVINVSKDRTGYPTQKPIALLQRIIGASSNEGNTVLDPFCGSGTTLVAALALGRVAIGMDANPAAIEIARSRCERAQAGN